jgi:hypothetical protein
MYRILAANAEVRERRDQLRHPAYARPELLATGPRELFSWDITKLKGPAKWTLKGSTIRLTPPSDTRGSDRRARPFVRRAFG